MPLTSFQNRVGVFHLSGGGWEILLGGFNLYNGGNLRISDFDHSNLFQGQKQHSVNIEYSVFLVVGGGGGGGGGVVGGAGGGQQNWATQRGHSHHATTSMGNPAQVLPTP